MQCHERLVSCTGPYRSGPDRPPRIIRRSVLRDRCTRRCSWHTYRTYARRCWYTSPSLAGINPDPVVRRSVIGRTGELSCVRDEHPANARICWESVIVYDVDRDKLRVEERRTWNDTTVFRTVSLSIFLGLCYIKFIVSFFLFILLVTDWACSRHKLSHINAS